MGWRGERFVEPSHQIAMGEEVHAQQRHEIRQAPAEPGGPLQIPHEQHRDQCGPNLNLHRIGRRADERLDLQVLFERLKEQLDLPAILIDGGDGGRAEAVMIGEKHQGVSRIRADRLDPAHVGARLAALLAQLDRVPERADALEPLQWDENGLST